MDRDAQGRFVKGNRAAVKVDPNEPLIVKEFHRFAEAKARELFDKNGSLPTMPVVEPSTGRRLPDLQFGSVLDMQRSMVRTVNNILYSDSIARRKEPQLHRMMLKEVGEYLHHGRITEYDPPTVMRDRTDLYHHRLTPEEQAAFVQESRKSSRFLFLANREDEAGVSPSRSVL